MDHFSYTKNKYERRYTPSKIVKYLLFVKNSKRNTPNKADMNAEAAMDRRAVDAEEDPVPLYVTHAQVGFLTMQSN